MATYTKSGSMYFQFYNSGQYTRFKINYTQIEDSIEGTYTLKLTSFGFTSSYRFRWSGSVSNLTINGVKVSMSGETSVSGLYLGALEEYNTLNITPSPATLGPFSYSSYPKITGSINYSWTPLDGGQSLSGTASAGVETGGGTLPMNQLHSHSYTSAITTPATCSATGIRTYSCACGKNYTESISALGHNYQLKEVIAPTCTTQGYDLYICQNDTSHTEKRNYTDMIGHNYGTVIVQPTCVKQGYTDHICKNCGHTYTDTYVEPLGHSWGEWEVTVEPQYQKEGEASRFCPVCQTTEKKILEALQEALRRALIKIQNNNFIANIAMKDEEGKIIWFKFLPRIGN